MGIAEQIAHLKTALVGKRVTPPVPVDRQMITQDDEPTARPGARDGASSWTALIEYEDAQGRRSLRRFTCQKIGGFEEATHVLGYCHERSALRTLRVDRIVQLACSESDECFDPVPHFEQLRMTGALNVEDRVLTDVARILVFLARCDSEYHPLEQTCLSDHVDRYCVRFNGTDAMASAANAGTIRLAPDASDVIKALSTLATMREGARVARFVLDAGAAIIDADNRHSPEEINWAVELSSALKAVSVRGN